MRLDVEHAMHPTVRALTFPMLLLMGCGAAHGRADHLFAAHDYEGAADLYEIGSVEHADDPSWRAQRDKARERALSTLAERALGEQAKGAFERADAVVLHLLDLSEQWRFDDKTLSARDRQAVESAISSAVSRAENEIARSLPKAPHLAATRLEGSALYKRAALSAEKATLKLKIEAAGRAQCERLAKTTGIEQPYWSQRVAAVCSEWRDYTVTPPPLPDLRHTLTIQGLVAGASAEEMATFRAEIERWFTLSRWYSASSARELKVTLDGALSVTFNNRPVEIAKDWVESVPYQVSESYQEPYQEMYTDTEYYTESVPYTAYTTVTRTCGSGSSTYSCTESQSHTEYRSEPRSRMVTKTRTAYRQATRMVTHYRQEPRVFKYAATEVTGTYAARLSMKLPLRDKAPLLVVGVEQGTTKNGIQHEVEFAPADIHPQASGLPTRAEFLAAQRNALETRLAATLSDAWREAFCKLATPTLEQAARCAYGDPKPPSEVLDVLRAQGLEL